MSSTLSFLAEEQIGIVIWCHGVGCRRPPFYIPPDVALERFGPITCEEVQRLVVCDPKADGCGQRGRDGKIQVLPSTMDFSDIRNGLPSGTSERKAVEGRAEARRRELAECEANGWDWEEVYGRRDVWPR